MSHSGLFAPDGCVVPTIPTREYTVTFTRKCEHTKIVAASVVIRDTDAKSAHDFAEKWLLQGPLRGQTVVAEVTQTGP